MNQIRVSSCIRPLPFLLLNFGELLYFFFPTLMQHGLGVSWCMGQRNHLQSIFHFKMKVKEHPLSLKGSCKFFSILASSVSSFSEGCYYTVSILRKQRMWTSWCIFSLCLGENLFWSCAGSCHANNLYALFLPLTVTVLICVCVTWWVCAAFAVS